MELLYFFVIMMAIGLTGIFFAGRELRRIRRIEREEKVIDE